MAFALQLPPHLCAQSNTLDMKGLWSSICLRHWGASVLEAGLCKHMPCTGLVQASPLQHCFPVARVCPRHLVAPMHAFVLCTLHSLHYNASMMCSLHGVMRIAALSGPSTCTATLGDLWSFILPVWLLQILKLSHVQGAGIVGREYQATSRCRAHQHGTHPGNLRRGQQI